MVKKKRPLPNNKRKKNTKPPDIKNRTLSLWNDYDPHFHKIIKFLSHESKNVFNFTMYTISVFEKYNDLIFEYLYRMLKKKHFDDTSDFEEAFYSMFKSFYDEYSQMKPLINNNNNIIYKYIKAKLKNVTLLNNNFYRLENQIRREIIGKNLVQFNENNSFYVLDEIIRNILKSIYLKNFHHVKNGLKNNSKLEITNKTFIGQVKKNQNLFKKGKTQTYKSLVNEYLYKHPGVKITIKSNQNYISRFIYQIMPKFNIPSDMITNIIKKTYKSNSSMIALRTKGKKASAPRYLPKDGCFVLPFYCRSFKEETIDGKDYLRLTVGEYVSNHFNEIIESEEFICLSKDSLQHKLYVHYSHLKQITSENTISAKDNHIIGCNYIEKNNTNIIDSYYLYIRKPHVLNDFQIKLIEINPIYDGFKFKTNIVYDKKIILESDKIDAISIDLGMKNLLFIYNPNGRQFIIKGSYIIAINEYYNRKIAYYKSILARENNNRSINANYKHSDSKYIKKLVKDLVNNHKSITDKENKSTSGRIRNLYIRRANRINDYFNVLVKSIIQNFPNVKTFVVGYNSGWKNGVNLGRDTNRKFCQIPYRKLLNKLKDQLELDGKKLIVKNEAYTSICDALMFESIEKHEPGTYSGKRLKRGLFRSGNGRLINADLNGAINIMRKWCDDEKKPMKKIKGEKIFSPLVIPLKWQGNIQWNHPVVEHDPKFKF